MRARLSISGFAAVGLGCWLLVPSAALADKPRPTLTPAQEQMIRQQRAEQQAQQQLRAAQAERDAAAQAAKAADAEATKNQGIVDGAKKRIEGARKASSDAKSDLKESTAKLRQIEAGILAAQKPDSEYASAKSAFEAAQENFRAVKERLTDEFKADQATLSGSDTTGRGSSGTSAKLLMEFLEHHAGYRDAKSKLQTTKAALDRVKHDLFAASEEWTSVSQDVRDATAESAHADQEARKGALQELPAKAKLRKAAAVKAAADAAARQDQAAMNKLKHKGPPMPR